MTDLLGPGDAGAALPLAATDPTVIASIAHPAPADTFFGDCDPANPTTTGTSVVSKWLNRLSQQIRRVIRNAGVPLDNTDDDMLWKAILAATAPTAASTSTLTTVSGQSLSANVYTTIDFPGTPVGFSNSGGVLTCTTSGLYSFSVTVMTSQAASGAMSVATFVEILLGATVIALNGDSVYTPGAATVSANVGASNTIYVAAGETITTKAQIYANGSSASQTINAGSSLTVSKVG